MAELYLIAGLGNPGPRYEATRHNMGFKVVERLAERLNLYFHSGKGNYLAASSGPRRENKDAILLLKPLTFMNNSGEAVRHAVDYFNIDPSRVLVIFDDFQLPFGKIRLRPGGSDGGHNGMASVIHYLGTPQVPRLRIGIGIGDKMISGDSVDFVLSSFSKEEQEVLPEVFDRAADAALSFVDEGAQQAMNRFNS